MTTAVEAGLWDLRQKKTTVGEVIMLDHSGARRYRESGHARPDER